MNIKEIIHENENEKLVQDNERKRRALNIIIHGATEIEENHITERNIEENKNDRDKEFIDTLLEKSIYKTTAELFKVLEFADYKLYKESDTFYDISNMCEVHSQFIN